MSYVAGIEETIAHTKESNKTPIGVFIDSDGEMTVLYEETYETIALPKSQTTVVEGTLYKDQGQWHVSILPDVVNVGPDIYVGDFLNFYNDIHYKPLIAGQTITIDIKYDADDDEFDPYLTSDYALFGWQNILKQCKEGDIVDGEVVAQTSAGLMVKIFTFDAVLPLSELDSDAFRKPKDFVGQTIKVKILKIYKDLHKVVVSRKFLTSHSQKAKPDKNEAANDKKISAEIKELRNRIEKLEAEIAKLKENRQQNLRSTVEKHDSWW